MPYHGEELLHDEQRDEPVESGLDWPGCWTTTMCSCPSPHATPSPPQLLLVVVALLVLHLSTHPLNTFFAWTRNSSFFFVFLACCCPFGHVFSAAALIFCHAPCTMRPPFPSASLSLLLSVLVRPGRMFMLADSCRHCVKCVWQMRGSTVLSPSAPAPLPLSMRNVLASFEIYVALVSWFIFWWPLFTSMTINCHCPSVFMSLGHE